MKLKKFFKIADEKLTVKLVIEKGNIAFSSSGYINAEDIKCAGLENYKIKEFTEIDGNFAIITTKGDE